MSGLGLTGDSTTGNGSPEPVSTALAGSDATRRANPGLDKTRNKVTNASQRRAKNERFELCHAGEGIAETGTERIDAADDPRPLVGPIDVSRRDEHDRDANGRGAREALAIC